MEEKDYALISDRELVDRLLIGDEEIVRYLFFDKCTPMFNYILQKMCITVIKSTENDDKYTVKKKRGTDGLSESIGSNKRRRESF